MSLLCLRLLLWHEFDPWPRIFHMTLVWPKKKKKKNPQNIKVFSVILSLEFPLWLSGIEPNCFREDLISVPGLAEWVKDPALP